MYFLYTRFAEVADVAELKLIYIFHKHVAVSIFVSIVSSVFEVN